MAGKRKCCNCKTPNSAEDYILGPGGIQSFCNFDCMTAYAYDRKSKGVKIQQSIARKEKQFKLEKLKTITQYANEAQASVNRYINVRDYNKPCRMCDKPNRGVRHACHYRSVKAAKQLRFNTYNIWSGCYSCNVSLSGNLLEYRIRLVKKLGSNRVEWLEGNHELSRYSIDYLKRVKRIFAKRAKHLTKLRGY